MKLNFSKAKLLDLDGKIITTIELHKTIASIIYRFTENLDLIEIARQINKGKEIELRDSEIAEILRIIKSKEAGLFAFVKKATIDYIEKNKGK